jgi:hypothetical protein
MYQSSRRPRVKKVLKFTGMIGGDDNDAAGGRITHESSAHHPIMQIVGE